MGGIIGGAECMEPPATARRVSVRRQEDDDHSVSADALILVRSCPQPDTDQVDQVRSQTP